MNIVLLLIALFSTPSDPSIQCTGDFAITSCKTFKEMVEAKDQDVVTEISRRSMVCFRPDEDVFAVVSLGIPSSFDAPQAGTQMAKGDVFYHLYSDGNHRESRMVQGQWTKMASDRVEDASFHGKSGGTEISFTPSSLSVSYSFQNMSGDTTDYVMEVRVSTLRFVQNWTYTLEGNRKGSMTKTGKCMRF
jgi:hypothetical protein